MKKLLLYWRIILFGCFIGCCSLNVSSQPVIDVSPPSKLTTKASRFKIIGKNQDGYLVRLFGNTDVLQSFGNDLKLIATRTVEFKNQVGLLQHIQLNKSGATVFYLTGDKKNTALIGQPLSSKFVENGKAVVVDSIFDKPDFVSFNLRVKQSLNQQYTLFYYPYFTDEKLESILFICLDRALQKVYARRLKLNRPDADMETAKVVVDNNGNTFAAFLNSKEKSLKNAAESFTVYKLLPEVEDAYETQIKIERNLFGEFYFEADNVNNSVVLSGFFDDEIPNNEPAAYGFFFTALNADSGTVNAIKYTNFDAGFMNELTGKLNQDPKLFTFNVKRVILRHDGGALIVAESLIKDTRETIFNSQFSPTFNSIQRISFFQFNDIIAFSLKPDGTTDWRAVMRKKQGSEEDNGIYSSFLISNERDKIRFIYLDEISTAAALREYVLSSDGVVSSNSLLNQESKDVMLLPKAGKQVAPNEVVIPSYLRSQLRLVKITF
jgi:hypothetical protein